MDSVPLLVQSRLLLEFPQVKNKLFFSPDTMTQIEIHEDCKRDAHCKKEMTPDVRQGQDVTDTMNIQVTVTDLQLTWNSWKQVTLLYLLYEHSSTECNYIHTYMFISTFIKHLAPRITTRN